jgi:CubicO group peptidase (beta-lactamase class C family)
LRGSSLTRRRERAAGRLRVGVWAVGVIALVVAAGGCSSGGTHASTSMSSTASSATASSKVSAGSAFPEPARRDLPAPLAARLQQVLQDGVNKQHATGATAAVVTPNGTWAGAVGVSGNGAPVVPTSVMSIASITKTFTAPEIM